MPTYPLTACSTYFPNVGVGVDCGTGGGAYPVLTQTQAWPQWVYQSYNAQLAPTYIPGSQYTIWAGWNTTAIANVLPVANNQYQWVNPARELSPEEVRANERRVARERLIGANRGRARMIRRRIAERRAEALLLEFLDPVQRQEWLESKAKSSTPYFHVVTKDGLRKYKVKRGLAGNITLVEAKVQPTGRSGYPIRLGARFCAHVYHPEEWIPDSDNVLAQKLLLESEGGEERFLAMANVS